jgi:thymidylate synthase ThyX
MTRDRRIYLLSPKDLPPETIAVTFAKTSRSPKPFDEIAAELTDEKSSRFHEKWVVGYGHASVAEHAVLHLALENISRLAVETVEGNRLASYTEKSTRYQQWDPDAFYIPEELDGHPLRERYIQACRVLFDTYQMGIPKLKAFFQNQLAQAADESEKAFDRRVSTAAIDVCRFLLPAASLANVGVTINARALEYAICKMLSSPLAEVRRIGEELLRVGRLETPTLIKYAACNQYMLSIREKAEDAAGALSPVGPGNDFDLIAYNPQGEDEVLAAILFRFGGDLDFKACLAHVRGLDVAGKKALAAEVMGSRGAFDQPPREFEYAQLTFEAVMDQGAYFEFKRHRMMTQTPQALTAELGYSVPKAIEDAGFAEAYHEAMDAAFEVYDALAGWNPDVASYLVSNGYNRRVLFTLNLREVFNFVRLRAAANAHFSIRRVAQHMVEAICEIYPILGAYLDAPNEDWRLITKNYFVM